MKKAIAVLLIIALSAFAAMPALAAPTGSVGKFSPTLDAEKDEAYGQSFSFGIFDQEGTTKGEGWYSTSGETATSMDATISYLWDDKYLYAFVEVIMSNVTDAGEDYIVDSDNPWESDSIELWFLWDDLDDASSHIKTSVSPFYGKQWGEGPDFEDIEANSQKIAKLTDKGYNGEFQIAVPPEFLKEGVQIKATLQVNDYNSDGTIAVGLQIGDTELSSVLTLGAPIVIAEPEPEPAPEPEPEPAVDDTAMGGGDENVHIEAEPAPAPVAVPQTGDTSIIVMIGLLAVAGMAVSVLKKKKI